MRAIALGWVHDVREMVTPGEYGKLRALVEANNPSEELYGFQRLEAVLNRLDDPCPQDVLKAVQADVDDFVGAAKQFDDLTMLCMKYRGRTGENEA